MAIYFAKSTNGFYDDEINEVIPSDAVEITIEKRQELLEAQSLGETITSDQNGNPITIPKAPPTHDELIALCKSTAKSLLLDTDWSQNLDVRPILVNADEFDLYRSEVRSILLNPVENPVFPEAPFAEWK